LLEIKQTNDGSATLFNPELNEHYHSTFGAYNESMHIFIKNGLLSSLNNNIGILEIGFGTGLNAILTYEIALQKNLTIKYTGLELFPLNIEIISLLNYEKLIKPSNIAAFHKMHQLEWNIKTILNNQFHFEKINADLNQYAFTDSYDLIYFDAFGPDVQPEMWSGTIFKKLFATLNSKGTLVTYSAKGLVKENLREAGFTVTRLQGPLGKRHIIRAIKS